MARQPINIGSSANDGTGDPLRTAFDKINDNFVELYGTDNDINTLDANLNVNNFAITSGVTNGNITKEIDVGHNVTPAKAKSFQPF